MENTNIIKFTYKNSEIQFQPDKENVMVNATDMAKIFNKKIGDFTRLEQTQNFIKVYSQSGKSRYENEFTEKGELIKIVKGHSSINGTWMNRVVALKFASWLNPEFELWVYKIIDKILFEKYNDFITAYKKTEELKKDIKKLQKQLAINPIFIELKRQQASLRGINKKLKSFNPNMNKITF